MKKFLALIMCLLISSTMLAGCSDSKASTVEGMLRAYSGGLLEMTATNGNELVFDVSAATISTTHGMLAGDDISVTYTGKIKDSDTSKATAVAVNDKTPADKEPDEHTIVGTLVNATMNTLMLKTEEYGELVFTTTNAKIDTINGFIIGNTIEITYIGEIFDGNTTGIQVVRVIDYDPNEANTPVDTKITITETNETVWAIQNVNVRKGWDVEFKRVGGLKCGDSIKRTGVCSNGWSRVLYNGKEAYLYSDYVTTTQPAAPTAAAPAPTPAPAHPDHTYSQIDGFVVNCAMSTTVINHNGNELTFATADASHHYKNGIRVGNYVTIEYSGTLNGVDTSGVVVHSISDSDDNPPATTPAPKPDVVLGPGPVISPEPTTNPSPPPMVTAPPVPESEPEPTPPPMVTAPPVPEPEPTPPPVVTAPPVPEPEPTPPPVVTAPPVPEPEPVISIPKIVLAPGPVAPPAVLPLIDGTITASTANTITVQTDDGGTIIFGIDGSTQVYCTISVGTYVTVTPRANTMNGNAALADEID
ncbi:MAG: SH3 domain-containing protein [Oscillospiraceae bacterium]